MSVIKIFYDTEADCDSIHTGVGLDNDEIVILNNDGYAGIKGIQLCDIPISWKDIETLRHALDLAEKMWKDK